jgi:hypothetical protein
MALFIARRPNVLRSPEVTDGRREQGARKRADRVLVSLVGQILDRRFAIDSRQHERRQQRRGARFKRCPRLPVRVQGVRL